MLSCAGTYRQHEYDESGVKDDRVKVVRQECRLQAIREGVCIARSISSSRAIIDACPTALRTRIEGAVIHICRQVSSPCVARPPPTNSQWISRAMIHE
jgi:hypothetical protein